MKMICQTLHATNFYVVDLIMTEERFQEAIDKEGCGAVFAAIKFTDDEFFA